MTVLFDKETLSTGRGVEIFEIFVFGESYTDISRELLWGQTFQLRGENNLKHPILMSKEGNVHHFPSKVYGKSDSAILQTAAMFLTAY